MVISDELRSPHHANHANMKGRLYLVAWFGSGLLRWVLLSSRSPQNHCVAKDGFDLLLLSPLLP